VTDYKRLRETFDSAALEYEAIRPGYPSELIEDVIALSGIPQEGQALEIGCGTGQATLPFARRGFSIHCLDIGAGMLAIAREKLRVFPKVTFQNISFEKWPVRANAFDLVYSATAFHWIPREVSYPKTVLAMRPGGTLAVFSNEHPRPYSGFFQEVQPIYRRLVPEWDDPLLRPSIEVEVQSNFKFIESTGLFSRLEVRTYPWIQSYSTTEYIRLLNTYSGFLLLPESRRQTLYQSIASLIERSYEGKVEKAYLAVLYLGKKEAAGS
jgi:SAM-dependent methyltransferase